MLSQFLQHRIYGVKSHNRIAW